MYRLAAAIFLTGMAAYSCFATEIPETFTGIANQVSGVGSGIFDVPENSAVSGTITFNTSAFSPDPVAPAGSSYLDVFMGGAGSVMLTLRDAGGTANVEADSAFLEISSSQSSPWALVVSGGSLSFSMVLQMQSSDPMPAGTSLFDFSAFGPATQSILISDPSASLGFDLTPMTAVAPEPRSAVLFCIGLTGLLIAIGCARLRKSVVRGTIPRLRIPNRLTRVY